MEFALWAGSLLCTHWKPTAQAPTRGSFAEIYQRCMQAQASRQPQTTAVLTFYIVCT